MEKVATWTWGDPLPVLRELDVYLNEEFGANYDIHAIFLFTERHNRLPRGFGFSQLIWLALTTLLRDPDKSGVHKIVKLVDVSLAAQFLIDRLKLDIDSDKFVSMLQNEVVPHMRKDEWLRLAYYLVIPVDLMQAAINPKAVREAPAPSK